MVNMHFQIPKKWNRLN